MLQYGDKLIAGNELSADKKANVKDDCNVLNDTRKKLNESIKRLKKKYSFLFYYFLVIA